MSEMYHKTMHWINGLGKEDWLYVLIGVVIIGLFCMRGFGSRADY